MLGDYNIVNVMVVDGRFNNGICSVKGCKNKAKYWLFVDDGKPKMSRHYSFTCEGHLSSSVRKANNYNKFKSLKKGKKS